MAAQATGITSLNIHCSCMRPPNAMITGSLSHVKCACGDIGLHEYDWCCPSLRACRQLEIMILLMTCFLLHFKLVCACLCAACMLVIGPAASGRTHVFAGLHEDIHGVVDAQNGVAQQALRGLFACLKRKFNSLNDGACCCLVLHCSLVLF